MSRAPQPGGVALVAGASRGLGLLISTELARRGYRVHGCSRSAESLERAAQIVATLSLIHISEPTRRS